MNERSRIRFMDMLLWLPAALDEPRDEAEMFTIVVVVCWLCECNYLTLHKRRLEDKNQRVGRWALFKRALLHQPTRASCRLAYCDLFIVFATIF